MGITRHPRLPAKRADYSQNFSSAPRFEISFSSLFFFFSSVINRRTRLAIFQLRSVDILGARLNLARFPIGALLGRLSY